MQNYELLFILPGTLAENETAPTVDKVKMMIERNGGTEIEVAPMDKKRLAYPMQHIRYGYFFLVYFKAEKVGVKQMQADLKIMPELLRAVIQKFDSKLGSRKIEFGQLGPTTNEVGAVAMGIPAEAFIAREVKVEPVKEEVKVVAESIVEVKNVETQNFASVEKSMPAEEKPIEIKSASTKKEDKGKISLEDIDKKLDEILDIDLGNV